MNPNSSIFTVSFVFPHRLHRLLGVDAQLAAGCEYGMHLGLAFQMVDDLLDVEGDAALLGKNTGMDAAMGKLTWVAAVGAEQTRSDALKDMQGDVVSLAFDISEKLLERSVRDDDTKKMADRLFDGRLNGGDSQ